VGGDAALPRPTEPLIGWADARRVVLDGSLTAAALIGFWVVWQGDAAMLAEARAVAFCVLGFSQPLYAFACRSREQTACGLGVLTNRALVAAAAVSAGL
jgi:hypothetical protein